MRFPFVDRVEIFTTRATSEVGIVVTGRPIVFSCVRLYVFVCLGYNS